jgi:uncharacterized hydantoinase/oxoprolinase family protein
VCADLEQLDAEAVDAIARYLHEEQVRRVEAAARRAVERVDAGAPVVALGAGAFLAREAAGRLGRGVTEGPAEWREAGAEPGPAAALARLLAARLGVPC